MSKIAINDVYLPFLNEDKRVQIMFGGSSSGKSYFLAQRCTKDMLEGKRNYLIIRNVGATIRISVFNEIKKAIISMCGFNWKDTFKIDSSSMTITNIKTNKQIIFSGCDDVEKLKSITPIDGVITDIWIEEATEVDYKSYKQLRKRLRGKALVKKRIILSFNPILQDHWIYKEFFGQWDDTKTLLKAEDLLILKTTYKDNLFLEQDDIDELENETDEYFKNVYTYGNWGVLGNLVYKNWSTDDLTELKKTCDKHRYGLDFGFSDDPLAFIDVYVNQAKKTIYILDEVYGCEMDNDTIAEVVKEKAGRGVVTCDSEDPRTINELKRRGIVAIGAKKGKDSRRHGINWIKGYKIVIDLKCQNFKNEIQQYKYREDKNGNVLPDVVEKNDHLLDALRYALEDLMLERQIKAGTRI